MLFLQKNFSKKSRKILLPTTDNKFDFLQKKIIILKIYKNFDKKFLTKISISGKIRYLTEYQCWTKIFFTKIAPNICELVKHEQLKNFEEMK